MHNFALFRLPESPVKFQYVKRKQDAVLHPRLWCQQLNILSKQNRFPKPISSYLGNDSYRLNLLL